MAFGLLYMGGIGMALHGVLAGLREHQLLLSDKLWNMYFRSYEMPLFFFFAAC
jgi:hypothetical protein